MELIEIDKIGAQAPERVFAGRANVFRPAVWSNRKLTRILVIILWVRYDQPAFGSQDDPVTIVPKRFSDQFFVGERPVDVGSIKERDAELHRPPNCRDRFRAVSTSVGPSHRHTTQTNRTNG